MKRIMVATASLLMLGVVPLCAGADLRLLRYLHPEGAVVAGADLTRVSQAAPIRDLLDGLQRRGNQHASLVSQLLRAVERVVVSGPPAPVRQWAASVGPAAPRGKALQAPWPRPPERVGKPVPENLNFAEQVLVFETEISLDSLQDRLGGAVETMQIAGVPALVWEDHGVKMVAAYPEARVLLIARRDIAETILSAAPRAPESSERLRKAAEMLAERYDVWGLAKINAAELRADVPQAGAPGLALLPDLRAVEFGLTLNGGLDAELALEASGVEKANQMLGVANLLIQMAGTNPKPTPEMKELLQSVSFRSEGAKLKIFLHLNPDVLKRIVDSLQSGLGKVNPNLGSGNPPPAPNSANVAGQGAVVRISGLDGGERTIPYRPAR